MSKKTGLIVAVVVGVVVLVSVVLSAGPAQQPPVITSLEAEADRISPSGSTDIVCVASSPGGSELGYDWWASAGDIEGSGANITWLAPDSEGEYTVSVIVTDTRGATATESLGINVTANRPPEIDSLKADATWTLASGSMQVACNASDPDGDELSYKWEYDGGEISPISEDGSVITWTAPEEVGEYQITVVVSDGHGGSATESLSVKVMPDQPPVIEGLVVTKDRHEHCYLQEASFGYHVGKEQEYDIECLVTDTVPGTELERFYDLFYEWEWPEGEVSEASADGSMITWIAPDRSVYTTVTVTVSDMAGNTASASVDLNVVTCSVCRFGYCP